MKRVCMVALSIITLASLSSYAQVSNDLNEQSQEAILDRKISGEINLTSAEILDLFQASLNSVKVPGGIVLLSSRGESHYKFEPDSLSLLDVLDSVVKIEPRYRWTKEHGVVNLIPASDSGTLLDVRISKFSVDNATISESLDALKGMPEVKNSIDVFGLNEFTLSICCGLSNPSPPPPKRFSIHLENVTVKDILNAIVREHGQAVWLYQEWQDWPEMGKKYFKLRIL